MAEIVFDRSALPEFHARLAGLKPDSVRYWGRMTPLHMVRHLRYVFDLSNGDETAPDRSIPVVRVLLYHLTFRYFTRRWPKNSFKAPDYFVPEPEGDFDAERAALGQAAERFVALLEEDPAATAVTPILGPMPRYKWARIHGAHCNYHFKQFGV